MKNNSWFALLVTCLFKLATSNVQVNITNHWGGGFEGSVCINITKELDGWVGHLIFSEDVGTVESWAAKVTKLSDREFVLQSNAFIAQQHVGARMCFAFEAAGAGDIAPKTIFYIEGMDGPPGNSTAPQHTGGGTPSKNYSDALGKSILFYDAQRSGKLPANNPIKWRGDSALNDCVPGGWYDAGDHVKFGLPLASTTTLLLWSLYSFKDGYVKAGQLDMMYDMIKWPLDYLLKAWDPTSKQLTAQVGDGNVDHKFWGRPEQMTMARPCLVVSESSPGSDVAAETAASLALGAITFKDKGDAAYSTQLLNAAESLYAFAKANRGKFSGSGQFYSSAGDPDELCEASVWLYRATGNAQYLADAATFVEVAWGWALSWDDKKVACQELLFEETRNSDYKNAVVGYFQGWLPGGTTTYTPCGLAWRDTWGANRYAGNTAFLALIAAEAGITPGAYRTWAIEQINYMLGDNKHDGGCYSFEIGYGSKYPLQPHHRGASCPDMPAPCDQSNLDIDAPSPQVLVGALVGGPDTADAYVDRKTDYIHNEVAIDYNSGFQGALAGIVHLIETDNFPPTHNKCPCKT